MQDLYPHTLVSLFVIVKALSPSAGTDTAEIPERIPYRNTQIRAFAERAQYHLMYLRSITGSVP